jgi:hypothetical protein
VFVFVDSYSETGVVVYSRRRVSTIWRWLQTENSHTHLDSGHCAGDILVFSSVVLFVDGIMAGAGVFPKESYLGKTTDFGGMGRENIRP